MARRPRPLDLPDRQAPAERPLGEWGFDDLLAEAEKLHGHLCPGQVLGVRMTLAGCREVGIERPRSAGKSLVVLVEIDRCATDAIQALTGVTLGKRTLKHLDYGKMAATFVNMATDTAVRVAARETARAKAAEWAPAERDPRTAQTLAYRHMAERDLLKLERVTVKPGWLDRRRVRVYCDCCGEGINYEREIQGGDRILCRPCSGESYLASPCAPAAPALEGRGHPAGA